MNEVPRELPAGAAEIDPMRVLAHARRTSFDFFAMKALTELLPDLEENWHLNALYAVGDAIAQGDQRRVIINIPPRSLKSVIFSSILPAFLLGLDPTCKIICVSYSRDLAEALAADTRKIMRTRWYRALFPGTRLARAALNHLATTRGGDRRATSIHGSITGFGADVIIIDDPLKADDAYSEAVRTGTNDWIRSSLMTRLNNRRTGRIVMVAQRLHEDDACGMLMEGGGWTVVSMPAVATEDQRFHIGHGRYHDRKVGDLLHVDRLPLSELAQLRAEMGSRNVEAQYQQQPTPADGQIFKRAWLTPMDEPYVPKAGDKVIQSWDMANKTGSNNDWSVCITAVVRRSQVIVIDVLRARLAFPELKKRVIAKARERRLYKLLIEDAAAGTQMIQTLQAEQPSGMPLPIAIKAERDKLVRADRAAARVEAGALLLPAVAPWLDTLINELLSFPGKHDDQVDALSQLLIYTEENRMARPVMVPIVGERDSELMHEHLGRG